jgi:hypothetical protein
MLSQICLLEGAIMNLKTFGTVCLIGLAPVFAGCATITRGTSDVWVVETIPAGASVKTSHGFYCESTPCAMKMPRKSTFTADISKPGYKTAQVSVVNKVSNGGGAAMAGNVLVGGIIGAGVDASNGAMLDLVPNPVKLTLEPVDGTPSAAAPAAEPVAAAAPVPPSS